MPSADKDTPSSSDHSLPVKAPTAKEVQVLDWERPERNSQTKYDGVGRKVAGVGGRWSLVKRKFDAMLPAQRTYFGRSRRIFLLVVVGVVLVLLVLAVGLGVGLGRHGRPQNLPLPGNTDHFTGDLTYYGTGMGACGVTSTDDQDIVAVSHIIFDAAQTGSNPNQNPLCGRKVRASRFDEVIGGQRSVDLTVVDRCVGCKATDLDTSPKAFAKMAAIESGRVDVTWAWLPAIATGS